MATGTSVPVLLFKMRCTFFFTVKTCLCALSKEITRSFSSLSANPFFRGPLHFTCLAKLRQSTRSLKKEYNSLCRRKRCSHKIIIANKVTNLIEARDVQDFEFFRERKLNGQTSIGLDIPAHVWTDYLKEHFTPKETSTPRDLVPGLPYAHQALSDKLRTRADHYYRHSHSTMTRRQVQKGIQYQHCFAAEP